MRFHPYLLYVPIIILLAILTTFQPLIILTSVIFVIFSLLLLKYSSLWIYLILLFSIIGELYRLPFFGENGLLINDLFVPLIVFLWLIKKIIRDRRFPKLDLYLPFLLFSVIASLSLLYNFRFLSNNNEILNSSFYLIRYLSYFLLIPLSVDLNNNYLKKQRLIKNLLVSAFLIALLGFIQLIIYNDFQEMAIKYGWDPHIGRLLSTWFDPNFIGGFFTFILCIIVGILLYAKSPKTKFWLFLLSIALLIALFLTYSRSSYLALAFGLFIIGLLKSRKLIIIGLIFILLLITVSDRAKNRVTDMYFSGLSLLGITAENPDATARLRVESWRQNLQIAHDHFWIGTGYNTLRYIKQQAGFVKDPKEHSAAGSDSSLLTIFTTTGFFGFLSFLWIYFCIFKKSLQNWLNSKNSPFDRGLGLGFFGGALSIFLVHCLFVNSLLFFPLLIYFWLFTSLLYIQTSTP